ncbi:MAG: hypothetical protein LQ347_003779 [Umbilicaria vellea]|nr:MAG: hypothetical protein LQ347_003779 [Umbilicaria vellea]
MALLLSLSALAVFIPPAFAQSSGYLNDSSTNNTATGVPYPLFNTTVSYGSTATPGPSGLITTYADVSAIRPSSAASSSFATSSIGNPASHLQSAEGSCGQVTITEMAYQTVTATAAPTIFQEGDDLIILETSAIEELSRNTHTQTATNYLTHTLMRANATGLHGNSTNGVGAALPTGAKLNNLKSRRNGHFAGR